MENSTGLYARRRSRNVHGNGGGSSEGEFSPVSVSRPVSLAGARLLFQLRKNRPPVELTIVCGNGSQRNYCYGSLRIEYYGIERVGYGLSIRTLFFFLST